MRILARHDGKGSDSQMMRTERFGSFRDDAPERATGVSGRDGRESGTLTLRSASRHVARVARLRAGTDGNPPGFEEVAISLPIGMAITADPASSGTFADTVVVRCDAG